MIKRYKCNLRHLGTVVLLIIETQILSGTLQIVQVIMEGKVIAEIHDC